ncbi:hypothetical protein [Clostridium arbusti]|nr:hypothetical protein [Clostridium arbusti]
MKEEFIDSKSIALVVIAVQFVCKTIFPRMGQARSSDEIVSIIR